MKGGIIGQVMQPHHYSPAGAVHALCDEMDFTWTFLGKQEVEVRFEVNFSSLITSVPQKSIPSAVVYYQRF